MLMPTRPELEKGTSLSLCVTFGSPTVLLVTVELRCFFCQFFPCSTVEYASREDVKNALRKLDGADLNGRKLRLTEDRGGHSRHRRSVTIHRVHLQL